MRQQRLFWLSNDDRLHFPPVEAALTQPNGLVAVGGDLSPERLVSAYRQGIFPWFEEDQPILWWSPDPRAVLYPARLRVRRSLAKRIRNAGFEVTVDRAFRPVMEACAAPRRDSAGTWITTGMLDAYTRLHQEGLAHSVEVWEGDELVGGLYGVGLGAVFFGESMFSHRADASKVALVWLVRHLQAEGVHFIDCQVSSSHLATLGAVDIPRTRFIRELDDALWQRPYGMGWTFKPGFHPLRTEEQEPRA